MFEYDRDMLLGTPKINLSANLLISIDRLRLIRDETSVTAEMESDLPTQMLAQISDRLL